MTIALFPGSFDPITNGHIDTVVRASKLFEKVYLVIMTNTRKTSMFTANERFEMAREVLAPYKNIEVIAKTSDLTVNVARSLHAEVLIRGVRDEQDYVYERSIAEINHLQDDQLETILLMAKPAYSFVSSSMIKEVAAFGGKLDKLVPRLVAQAMTAKLGDDGHEEKD